MLANMLTAVLCMASAATILPARIATKSTSASALRYE
jgi:ABC-type lipoprotein release transport system permease subunit